MTTMGRKVSMPLSKSSRRKAFICRIVEDVNKNFLLKFPSEFAVYFSSLGLNNIGLHVPLKKTWLGRFVSESGTVEGIENFLEAYLVNVCYMFCLEYIGGTEFTVQIFNEYAVEVDYTKTADIAQAKLHKSRIRPSVMEPLSAISELKKDKLKTIFCYNACSGFEGELEIVIHAKHLGDDELIEVFSYEQATELGFEPGMQWIVLGFKKNFWKIKLQWKRNRLFFGSKWNKLARASNLTIGDKLMLVSTDEEERFEVVIFHKEQSNAVYKSGTVDGEGHLKWFKVLNWISVHAGELEVPPIFLEKYGDDISDDAEIYLADGMVYGCNYSKTKKLLFGIKTLMRQYGVKEDFTIFLEYLGNSKFYGSIFNEEGLEIFNCLQEKLLSYNLVKLNAPEEYIISDSDSNEGCGSVHILGSRSTNQTPLEEEDAYAVKHENVLPTEYLSKFSVKLLKSHVDQNNHGVFLPRFLHEVYKKWNKSTSLKLIMDGKIHELKVLRRKKSCRLGLGWNEFTMKNNLKKGDTLDFFLQGTDTLKVKKSV